MVDQGDDQGAARSRAAASSCERCGSSEPAPMHGVLGCVPRGVWCGACGVELDPVPPVDAVDGCPAMSSGRHQRTTREPSHD